MHATLPLLQTTDFPAIRRKKLEALQINLGYLCNQSCLHCHVNAGPTRTELMSLETVNEVLAFLENSPVKTLDVTGGAPELNPHFRYLVAQACSLGVHVIDRCNLTVLEEPGQHDTAEYLADKKVEIVASLPCYIKENVEKQRGNNVFDSSIRGLQALNALGYGRDGSGLTLHLVYNPQGPVLPPAQEGLEKAYKEHLGMPPYEIVFNRLYTITNMPIQRFGSTLISRGEFQSYMKLLKDSYHKENLAQVMCRNLISVDWRGYLYDCDFNQMLGIAMPPPENISGASSRRHIRDMMNASLEGNEIAIADHCYGCTAGHGSSCGGALE